MIDDVSNNLNLEDFKKKRIYSDNKNFIKIPLDINSSLNIIQINC